MTRRIWIMNESLLRTLFIFSSKARRFFCSSSLHTFRSKCILAHSGKICMLLFVMSSCRLLKMTLEWAKMSYLVNPGPPSSCLFLASLLCIPRREGLKCEEEMRVRRHISQMEVSLKLDCSPRTMGFLPPKTGQSVFLSSECLNICWMHCYDI